MRYQRLPNVLLTCVTSVKSTSVGEVKHICYNRTRKVPDFNNLFCKRLWPALPSIIETSSSEDINHRTTQFAMRIPMPIFLEDEGWGRKENGDHCALLFSHTFPRTVCIYLWKHNGFIAQTLYISHFLFQFCEFILSVSLSSQGTDKQNNYWFGRIC